MAKFIFITGGVVSGLGKGITGSSLAAILKNSGYKVFMQKFDPYLNVDPGTMNPYQHGEVFVTSDGSETDLDLGHYERFIDENLNRDSNITAGKIYFNILQKERHGDYKGATVQMIPHVTNEIKNKVYSAANDSKADFIITEIGGTVGDFESLPFIEAIRQVHNEQGHSNVAFIHVALVPYLASSHESKTKPVQNSVRELLSYGIQPNIIVAREENDFTKEVDKMICNKIALFCNIPVENVLIVKNASSIYKVPNLLYQQNVHKIVAKELNLTIKEPNMSSWNEFVLKIKKSVELVTVTIVGKYIELPDAYLSVIESLHIAGFENKTKIEIKWIKAEDLKPDTYKEILKNSQGIIIPGGFGNRGIEGMILAIQYSRENNIPYLGLCLGMQLAAIEFARNVCNLKTANSTEFNIKTLYPIFHLINKTTTIQDLGGTLRLGNYATTLKDKTLAKKLYKSNEILERHRHRYEFNNDYKKILENNGLVFSGIYKEKELVEIIELPLHKFFIGCQYHAEFTSRPNKPNPLFNGFVQAIIKNNK